jgi:hypothetical protein
MAEKIVNGTPIYMVAIMIVCILLVVVGFIMPPIGEIHGSVLTAIGELGGLGVITDFVTKLPAIIRAGGKATITHGDTHIEVGARKKDFGGFSRTEACREREMDCEAEEGGNDENTD